MFHIDYTKGVDMKIRRTLALVALISFAAPNLSAGWCSGSGPGWFIECWNTGCTITYEVSPGVWIAENVDRSYGEGLCNEAP